MRWRWLQGEIGDLFSFSSWKERVTEGPRQDSLLIEPLLIESLLIESLQSGLRREAQPENGSSIGMREG